MQHRHTLRRVRGGGPSGPQCRPARTRLLPVKTYDIELQRLKSARHDKGLIEIGADVLVLPRQGRDAGAPRVLSRPGDPARPRLLLLKQQLAELDKLQPRSRRSGRC